MSKRVVLATFGSFGDLSPFLGIGREFRKRGYESVIASSAEWQTHIENAGFEFRLIRPGWDTDMWLWGTNPRRWRTARLRCDRASYE